MTRKIVFEDALAVERDLFDHSQSRLIRFLPRLFKVTQELHRLELVGNYGGLGHHGPFLYDINNYLLDPYKGGFKSPPSHGTSNACSSTFHIAMGIARQLTRLVLIFYQTTYGSSLHFSSFGFIQGYQLDIYDILKRDRDPVELAATFNLMMEAIYERLNNSRISLTEDRPYEMSVKDTIQVLREASNIDID